MEQPQLLQPKRSLEIMKSPPPSPMPVSEEKSNTTAQQQKKAAPAPVAAIARQQSILRGTASSRAKAVRPPPDIEQRRLYIKTRKQSLTNLDPNRLIVNSGPQQQRRSSWSPLLVGAAAGERKSPPPPSPAVVAEVGDEQIQQSPTATTLEKKAATTTANASNTLHNRSIVNAPSPTTTSSPSSSSSTSNSSVHTTVAQPLSKENIQGNNSIKQQKDATAAAKNAPQNQQQQTIVPLETPPPDDNDSETTNKFFTNNSELNATNDDEVSNIRHCPDQQHHHHHQFIEGVEDDSHLPKYMRRPICAACNRNVKVTSSSESLLLHQHNSSSTTTNRSRRSSISNFTNTNHVNNNKKRSSTNSNTDDIKIATTTSSTSTTHSNSSNNNEDSRSHSPTSPIPTRKMVGAGGASASSNSNRKKSTLKQKVSNEQDEEAEEQDQQQIEAKQQEVIKVTAEKWNQLISQQQKLLEFINRKDSTTIMTLSATQFHDKMGPGDETMILETQLELLKRFESVLLSQQLSASASSFSSQAITAIAAAAPRLIEAQEEEPKLNITSWQTKFEYGMTRMKWSMSQWFFGTIVGSGEIEEQDFDHYGYTKNVVISGVCVTTEPGLLPKNLQKYYINNSKNVSESMVCHKYIIYTKDRDHRLSKFALLDEKDWIKDEKVDQCELSYKEEENSITRTKHCSVRFGVVHRRHHCRCCGHIFCQTHSSNLLPLFLSNGEERGEWSRVCDLCFYARIDPQFISRS